jgi:hypothetical protein
VRRRLVVVLVVLLVAIVIVDVLARRYAESNVEEAVRRRSGQIGTVAASIDSFPFVGRLLLWSDVPHLDLRIGDIDEDVAGAVEELRVDIDGLELDRGVLVNDRRARITGVDRVRVTAVIDLGQLAAVARAAGIDVTVHDGTATFGTAGVDVEVEAEVTVEGGFVVLTARGLPPIRLPLPVAALVPCDPSAEIDGDLLVVTCASDQLPEIVVAAIGSVDLQP